MQKIIPKININNNLKAKPKWLTRGMKSNMRKRLNFWYSNKRFKWSDTSLVKEYDRLKKVCENEVKSAVKY